MGWMGWLSPFDGLLRAPTVLINSLPATTVTWVCEDVDETHCKRAFGRVEIRNLQKCLRIKSWTNTSLIATAHAHAHSSPATLVKRCQGNTLQTNIGMWKIDTKLLRCWGNTLKTHIQCTRVVVSLPCELMPVKPITDIFLHWNANDTQHTTGTGTYQQTTHWHIFEKCCHKLPSLFPAQVHLWWSTTLVNCCQAVFPISNILLHVLQLWVQGMQYGYSNSNTAFNWR